MEQEDIFIDSDSRDSNDVEILQVQERSSLHRDQGEIIQVEDDSDTESMQSEDEVVENELTTREQSSTLPTTSGLVRSEGETSVESTATPSDTNTSLNDFASPKKYKVKVTEGKREDNSECTDEDAECCPICFERWENSGSHRLASLKCGHLFGQSCIEKWLHGQGGKCPQCNAKASKKDIRLIYAKALKMLDTSERDRALVDLESERKLRQKAELETAQLRLNYQMALDECNRLREEIERQKSTLDVMRVQSTSSTSGPGRLTSQVTQNQQDHNFVLEKTIKINEQGNCRVLGYCSQLSSLCISQPSSSPLFPGFGVKKLSTVDFKTSQYVAVHSKQIRDIVFSPANMMMLSASMDKTVKLTNLASNSVVQTYNLPVPAWSCAYNLDNQNYLYAGLLNGSVSVFDIRNTSECVKTLNTDGSKSPVLALHYLPTDNRSVQSRMSGLMVGQLDKCSFYEFTEDDYKPHILPVDGSVCSVSLDTSTRHALLTYRPNARQPCVRHQMSSISTRQLGTASVCSLQPVHTFHGGSTQKLLSRNRLVPHPEQKGNLLVCACDEASCSVHIWEATTGVVRQKLPSNLPIMDVCHIATSDKYHLCSLAEKQLLLYTWR